MYDFNTPPEFSLYWNTKIDYFLNLKNQQYMKLRMGETLFDKMCSIIEEDEKNQESCVRIIKELLISSDFTDCVKETSIGYVLKMKSDYSTDILKLLGAYWFLKEKKDLQNYKKIMTNKKLPFNKLMTDLQQKTDTFNEMFDRYLKRMEKQYKENSYLYKIILQKDRHYLLLLRYFFGPDEDYINKKIPYNNELMNLHDDFIFTIISKKQIIHQEQIMKSSNKNELDKIFEKFGAEEVLTLLLARTENQYENLLEQMLKKPDNNVDYLLKKICKAYGMDSFYTKKMLLMVIITISIKIKSYLY